MVTQTGAETRDRPDDLGARERIAGQPLCLIGVKVDAALRREIDAYAEAHGVSRSRAAGHYLAIARETIHEREGVPAGRADELMEAVDGLRAAVDIWARRPSECCASWPTGPRRAGR